MTAKSKERALYEYQQQIGKVLNCVSHCWVYSFPSKRAGRYLLIAAPADADRTDNPSQTFLRLKRGKETLFFRGYQHFEVFDDESFRISVLKYYYSIWNGANELLIDFHYHPRQTEAYKGHLHIPNPLGVDRPVHFLINKHIPTARVSVEDIVRFMVQEVNVSARTTEWQEILRQTEEVFSKRRTK